MTISILDLDVDAPDYGLVPVAIVRCGFGPVVGWGAQPAKTLECAACEGAAELTIFGKDGNRYEVRCPACEGMGETVKEEASTAVPVVVWTDADGQVVEPDLNYEGMPTAGWLMAYAARIAA